MDLVAGVETIYVITRHVTKSGDPKLVRECTFPLTGAGVVSRVFTDLAILDITPDGFRFHDLAPGITEREVRDYRR